MKRYISKQFAPRDSLTLTQVVRVAASYLIFDSPQSISAGKTAKNVFLVPVHAFRQAIQGSPHGQLQQVTPVNADEDTVDDVANLTASQLNEVLKYGSIPLVPPPSNNRINEWLGNFIEGGFYEREAAQATRLSA